MQDHYHTLGIPPNAGLPAIRRAHRRLVLKYHPDKAPDNPLAEARFRDIQEAYDVLSGTASRAAYDEERWLRGHSGQRKPRAVTPAWLVAEARRLEDQLRTTDTYRLDLGLLQACLLYLLNDAHLAVLREEGHPPDTVALVQPLLKAAALLPAPYLKAVMPRLRLAAGENAELGAAIEREARRAAREQRQKKLMPWVVVLAVALLCVGMVLWGRR